jgi:hypothetical protein
MSEPVPGALRELVQQRARLCCEYCLVHEEDSTYSHEVDHIISRKHGGETREDNLAWACFVCNRLKGAIIASIDLETAKLARLYHPRIDSWVQHFRLDGPRIVPLTDIGRVTEHILRLNHPDSVQLRKVLIAQGRYPP